MSENLRPQGAHATEDEAWKQFALHAKSAPSFLTVEECEAVRNDALAVGMERALVRTGDGLQKSRVRTSDVVRLPRIPEREWLYERILASSAAINSQYWRFALTGIDEIQISRYRPLKHYLWHFDTFPGSTRKITFVVNLSSPKTYWRGGLEIRGRHDNVETAPLQGSATWFPSYLRHRAKAPWFGERWVLVTWLKGPPWT